MQQTIDITGNIPSKVRDCAIPSNRLPQWNLMPSNL